MKLKIVLYPDPILGNVCSPVPEITDEIRTLARDMLETMYEAPGVGLAAPQVGVPIRLIVIALAPQVGKLINMVVYDPAGKDEPKQPHVIINPEVTLTGREIVSEKEGCLSVPMDFRADVLRSETIHLKALDLDGNVIDRDIDGFEAIIVQHETDHLKGVLFIDKIGRIRRAFYDNKVKKWLKRQKQAK